MEAVVGQCTCSGHRTTGSVACGSRGCSQSQSGTSSRASSLPSHSSPTNSVGNVLPKFFLALFCGALTVLIALAGAFTGAVTGAFAGRASDSGVLRGAGLGALAGAVLSVELLQASRTYWCTGGFGSRSSPSMINFIEELFDGRLVREHIVPAPFTDNRWQATITSINYDEMYGVQQKVASRGLPRDSLWKLPSNVITKEARASLGGGTCTICLQDFEVGETVRCLHKCHHLFHLMCVDTWLVRHGSCPVCREKVLAS